MVESSNLSGRANPFARVYTGMGVIYGLAVDCLKVSKGAANIMYPCPTTLVTCRDKKGRDNIIAIAWIGVMSNKPPMIGMGFNKSRLSTAIIEESGTTVVILPGLPCHVDDYGNYCIQTAQ